MHAARTTFPRSECKAIHASCESFVSKGTLGPFDPVEAVEGIGKGVVGGDEVMKIVLCQGELAEAECNKGEDFANARDVCDRPQLR